MRRSLGPSLLLASCLAAAPALAQRSSDADLLDLLTRRMKICAEQTETSARLSCYDRVESNLSAPAGAPAPQVLAPPATMTPPGTQPLAPPTQPGGGQQVFRDPVTGRVYDPATVGKDDGKPVPAEDRAFDPRAQGRSVIGPAPGVYSGAPRSDTPVTRVIGSVPRVSGPGSNVPIVTLELPSLRVVPGGRWQLTMNLANNGQRAIEALIGCTFNNGDRRVDEVNVSLRNVGPGDKVTAEIAGPPSSIFVDNAPCAVIAPLQ